MSLLGHIINILKMASLLFLEPYFNNGTKHFAAQFDVKFNEPFFEHVKGVTVEDKALVINYTGLYYVYLSIQMGPKFGKPAGAFKYQVCLLFWWSSVFLPSSEIL